LNVQDEHKGPLTSVSATALAAAIREKRVSVSEVVAAHLARIQEWSDLNAVIWPLFEQATKQAQAADAALAQGVQPGALFGVPMTLKDQYMLRGTPTSCGLAHRAEAIVDSEGPLVTRLREQGAIFLGKTNLPQLLVSHECDHGLYGAAKNPWDPARTPGGSSGGEAAIIAVGGSPLGLGCDMGGSIRVPAHCCGIVGLKPTTGRFPNDDTPLATGYFADLFGFEGFLPQPGPMARHVDDLKLAMDALLAQPIGGGLDAPPVPWSVGPIVEPIGLRIGIYTDNGFFAASPALRRLAREAGEALAARGLDVLPFDPPDPSDGIRLGLRLLVSDGAAWVRQALAGEAPISDVRSLLQISGVPTILRGPTAALLKALGQEHAAQSMRELRPCDAREYWRLCAERTRYRMRFVQAMNDAAIDVLVCPPYGLPAPLLGSNGSGAGTIASSHANLFNVLGMPAGVVAAGCVGPEEESDRPHSRDRTPGQTGSGGHQRSRSRVMQQRRLRHPNRQVSTHAQRTVVVAPVGYPISLLAVLVLGALGVPHVLNSSPPLAFIVCDSCAAFLHLQLGAMHKRHADMVADRVAIWRATATWTYRDTSHAPVRNIHPHSWDMHSAGMRSCILAAPWQRASSTRQSAWSNGELGSWPQQAKEPSKLHAKLWQPRKLLCWDD
jgi:fatty acid amide hydrolase